MHGRDDLDALIARAQTGEVRAFEQLIASHLGVIRRYARAFADQAHDADDLAQEALIKAYKSLRLFRYQSSFSTWLYTIVRSVFLDTMKSRAGRERARTVERDPTESETELVPAADELMAQAQDRQRVWRALSQVPVEFRTALVLFDVEGCSYDEVAAIESVAVGTVKSRLSRGRAHLARLLREHGDAPRPAEGDGRTRRAAGTSSGSSSSQDRGGST